MRVFAAVLAAIAGLATVISLIGPNVDLDVARLFFDPASGRFPAPSLAFLTGLRDHGTVSVATCAGLIAVALWRKLLSRPLLSTRAAIFLVATLLLGPGLMVNGIFKEHWHRPRPVQVTQFGGDEPYVPWWDPDGACDHNCSFASGEVASAAWMFAPATLTPPPWRAAAMAGAALFTVAIALARMAAGGHFLTDVVFAALMTLFVLWLVGGVLFRWRWPKSVRRFAVR